MRATANSGNKYNHPSSGFIPSIDSFRRRDISKK